MNTARKKDWTMALLLALAGFLVFSPSLSHSFVYDDHVDIQNIDAIFTPDGWKSLLTTATARLYRPCKYLSYWVDHLAWGWDPAGFHLTNLLWHALASGLTYLFLRELSLGRRASVAGGLFFAIHPVRTEAVVWISSRASLMSAVAVLLMLMGYSRWRATREKRWAAGLAAAALFGFFSKEDALMALPVLLLFDFLFPEEKTSPPGAGLVAAVRDRFSRWTFRKAGVFAGLVGIACVYLIPRQLILSGLRQGEWAHGFTGFLATLPGLLVRYMALMIWPHPLSPDQAVNSPAGFDLLFFASTLLVPGSAALFFLTWRKSPLLAFSVGWFYLFLFPVMGWIPINQPFADRFLYLPGVAFSILLAFAWDRMEARRPDWRPAMIGLAAAVTLGYVGISVQYTRVWQNDTSLWRHVLKGNPRSHRGLLNLGVEANNRGEFDRAIQWIDQALEVKPDYLEAEVARAYALAGLGRADEAEALYRSVLGQDPDQPVWLNLLAHLLMNQHRFTEARQYFDQVIDLRPLQTDAYLNAGICAAQAGDYQAARRYWEKVLDLNPGHEGAVRNLQILQHRLESQADE